MRLFGPPNVDKLKAKKNIWGLIKALDSEFEVREAAVDALGEIGDPRAVEPLISILVDNKWYCCYAIEALGRIGDPRSVDALSAALNHNEVSVREAAVDALGEIGDPRAVKPLGVMLKGDKDSSMRWRAACALEKINDPSAVDPLITALGDENWNVRRAATSALDQIGDTRAVEPLLTVLGDEDWHIQEAAADALEKMRWQPDMGADGAAYWIVKREPEKCVEIGAPALKPLIAAINHSSPENRRVAAKALVALYQSGKLSEEQKAPIINLRSKIVQSHHDRHGNDCAHTDRGIGVSFPV
jgi:HEAT repeat protein